MSPLPDYPAGPLWRDIPGPGPFLHNLLGPQERVLPPGSPRAPIERNAPFSAPTFNYLSEFSVNGIPPHVSQWGLYGERCLSPHPSSTHKSQVDSPPARLSATERHSCPLSPSPHIRSCNITSTGNCLNTLEGTFV